MDRRFAWVLLALLPGCATSEREVPPADAPPLPLVQLAPGAVQRGNGAAGPADRPDLCTALAAVVDATTDGFTNLRDRPLGAGRWRAKRGLPGIARCTVEGSDWPNAHYRCAGPRLGPDSRDEGRRRFDDVSEEIETCLAKPIWIPHEWQRGRLFEFAMGERLVSWTDASGDPPTQLVLKVQRDVRSEDYQVKLDLGVAPSPPVRTAVRQPASASAPSVPMPALKRR